MLETKGERIKRQREAIRQQKRVPDGFLAKLHAKFNRDVTVAYNHRTDKYVLMCKNFAPERTSDWSELAVWQNDDGSDLPLNDYGIAVMRGKCVHASEADRDDRDMALLAKGFREARAEDVRKELQYRFGHNIKQLLKTNLRRKDFDPRYQYQRGRKIGGVN